MIRGTTAPFKIKLPYTIGELEWVTMKWWQDGNKGTLTAPLPITKRLAHCSMSNIYVCELFSDLVKDELYYFSINDINYKFIAPQNISAGNLLKYDINNQILTVGESSIMLEVIDNIDNIVKLIFVNETSNSKELYVTLTADETKRFSDKHKAKMQFRARLISDGRIIGCRPKLITVYPINDDLLEDDYIPSESQGDWIILDGASIND